MIKSSDAFVRLLCNCARYLYEVGDYDFCVKVCETARLALVDEDSILHADICSSAGSALYELNRLDDCRKEWERFFRIQKEKLWDRELEVRFAMHTCPFQEDADHIYSAIGLV